MGQAFDESGHVLGDFYGDSKREVFDELMKRHPEANELRIKSMKERIDLAEKDVRMINWQKRAEIAEEKLNTIERLINGTQRAD